MHSAVKVCNILGMIELSKMLLILVWMTELVGGDPEEDLVIDTASGQVRGERLVTDTGRELDMWASIPYAEPPLGGLRFVCLTLICVQSVP